AVAVQNARAAHLQEDLLLGRGTDQITEKTEGVTGTVPCGAFEAHAQLYRPVSVGERGRRNMAVLPAKPTEDADVLRNLLFAIHPKAVFETEGEGGLWDGY